MLAGAVAGVLSFYVLYMIYSGDARYTSLVAVPALAAACIINI